MAERTTRRVVRVSYFALLRDETGRDEEQVATACATAGELYAELQERYRLSLPRERLRVAINATFADWDSALADGDLVVFIPPVAGG
ncbi:MAG: MoaD/ThiS family protein [Spirochaetaceae bacterium]|nr:MoaD/ThiS family protein [Spirochaetaceae bacterium]